MDLGLLLLWLLILISGGPLTTLAERRLGEVPSGGARALWLLWGFSKVTRRKGGTHSRRDRSNGYVLTQTPKSGRPEGRHGNKLPHHKGIFQPESCVDTHAPIASDQAPLTSVP